MKTVDRHAYAEMYGPTTGDRIRLDYTLGAVIGIHKVATPA